MTTTTTRKLVISTTLALCGIFGGAAHAAWIAGPIGAGTHNYNLLTNWTGGVIDDTITNSFSASGVTFQLTADRTTVGNLTIQDTGGSGNWTLNSNNSARVLSLNGNFFYERFGSGTMTIGSTTAGNNFTLDLMGGVRQFNHLGNGDTMTIHATVNNGGIHVVSHANSIIFSPTSNPNYTGLTRVDAGTLEFQKTPASLAYDVRNSGVVWMNNVQVAANAAVTLRNSGTMRLTGAAGALAPTNTINLLGTSTLQLGDATGGNHSGSNRLPDTTVVSLNAGGGILLQGINGGTTTESVSASADGYGRLQTQHGTGAAEAIMSVNLDRTNRGIVHVSGNDLGAAAAPFSRLLFTAAPTTIGGGGGAGTTNISIVPWLVSNDPVSGLTMPTFATYDPTNGVRLLNTTTEYVVNSVAANTTQVNPATITSAAADTNLRLVFASNGTITLNGNQTFNSLNIDAQGGPTVNGTGVISITSGAILMSVHNNPLTIGLAGLDFGSAEGVITQLFEEGGAGRVIINSPISGSNGVTFSGGRGVASGNPNFNRIDLGGTNTYTGQTTINNVRLQTLAAERLPNGSVVRMSPVSELRLGGIETIAGLTGGGEVVLGSNTILMGQASGDLVYDGLISGAGGLQKFAGNTQTLNANNTYTGATVVNGGTLLVNGTTTNQANYIVAGGGRFGGNGTIGLAAAQSLTVNANGALAPGDGGVGTLTVDGNVTINGTLEMELDGLTNDLLIVDGTLTLGPNSVIDFDMLNPVDEDAKIVLAEFTSLVGKFSQILNLPGTHFLAYEANQLLLVPVPEPSALVLLGAGVVGLVWRRRRPVTQA